MNPSISFVSGIVAAFTPCVIVLFPLVLYRFFSEDRKRVRPYLAFVMGFLISYVIFGYFISGLFSSFIQNGVKVGLGLLLVILGILSLMGKLNPLNIPVVKNPLLLGGLFALALSFNPCSLPYLAAIITLNTQGAVMLNLVAFGFGLLAPSIIFAFIGQSLLAYAKKGYAVFGTVSKLMSIVLIASGAYLALSIRGFAFYDVYIVALFLLVISVVLLRAFFIVNSKEDLLRLPNILLLLSFLLIVVTAILHCNTTIADESASGLPGAMDGLSLTDSLGMMVHEQESCSASGVSGCEICMRCITTFSIAASLFLVAIAINRWEVVRHASSSRSAGSPKNAKRKGQKGKMEHGSHKNKRRKHKKHK